MTTAAAPVPTTTVTLPWLGSVRMSRPELAFVGGIAVLGVLGFLDWPIALVLGAGHILAADRTHQGLHALGEALEEAG